MSRSKRRKMSCLNKRFIARHEANLFCVSERNVLKLFVVKVFSEMQFKKKISATVGKKFAIDFYCIIPQHDSRIIDLQQNLIQIGKKCRSSNKSSSKLALSSREISLSED